jgi:pantoate--beta-alanine ligase
MMIVHEAIDDFRRALDHTRSSGSSVGLVPTMGALHDGHMSLIERASRECDQVAVTIFVNPLQFGDVSDITSYPRTLAADLDRCAASGVAVVLAPSVEEMYPGWPELPSTTVSVGGLGDEWEGRSRPGHFDGVATVVAKLFSIAGRCRAYFGEKDFQQLALVRRMAADLGMPVEVVGCPTVRDRDGVALSSRNVRLTPEQRRAATVLPRALAAGTAAVASGHVRPDEVSAIMSAVVERQPLARLDYAVAVDAATLEVPSRISDIAGTRLLVAALIGTVRLIDNCAASVGPLVERELVGSDGGVGDGAVQAHGRMLATVGAGAATAGRAGAATAVRTGGESTDPNRWTWTQESG